MKVLMYLDPAISERFAQLDNIINRILFFNKQGIECKVMMADWVCEFQKEEYKKYNLDIVMVNSDNYHNLFNEKDKEAVLNKVLFNNISDREKSNLKLLYKNLLNDWTPDVVIYYESNNQAMKELYPCALHLSMQAGIFSRLPFCISLFFDPNGFLALNSLKKFEREIKNFQISTEENLKLVNFKKEITEVIRKKNPFKSKFKKIKDKYKNLILLPLSAPPVGLVKSELDFDDSTKMFYSIIDKIPSDFGVILTQHPAVKIFCDNEIIKLKEKYPNLIYIKETETYPISSLFMFEYVDIIINFHSTTAFQSLFWDKKIVSFANTSNDLIKDAQGLDDICALANAKLKDKNNILYWLLTRYYTWEFDYKKPGYIATYFCRKHNYIAKNGTDFNYFSENVPIEIIHSEVCKKLKANINRILFLSKINILKNMFSKIVYINGCHNVINVFGIKMKFKRQTK